MVNWNIYKNLVNITTITALVKFYKNNATAQVYRHPHCLAHIENIVWHKNSVDFWIILIFTEFRDNGSWYFCLGKHDSFCPRMKCLAISYTLNIVYTRTFLDQAESTLVHRPCMNHDLTDDPKITNADLSQRQTCTTALNFFDPISKTPFSLLITCRMMKMKWIMKEHGRCNALLLSQ